LKLFIRVRNVIAVFIEEVHPLKQGLKHHTHPRHFFDYAY